MTSTNREILWMLKQMRSTIENVETIDGTEATDTALANVIAVTIEAIQAFEQAIVTTEETKDETTTSIP